MSTQENNQESIIDADETKQCRICFDDNDPTDLISPCLCSGGSAYVHRKCLDLWRSENILGRGFKVCNVCQFEYVIEPVIADPKAERERLWKYYFFVIRDSTAAFLLIQLIIFIVAFILKAVDKNHGSIKNFYPESINTFLIYYASSLILLLAIVGAITLLVIFCTGENRRTSSSSSRSSGEATAIVIACILVGLIVGIIGSVVVVQTIMKGHARKLWLRQEANKYIVRDFQGRRSELDNYRRTASV